MKTTRVTKLLPQCGFVLLTCLFILQCQSFKKFPNDETQGEKHFQSWDDYSAALKKYKQWHIDGKIGFTFPYQGKRKAVSASIDWQQDDQNFDMAFSGPLGMGRFTIEKRPTKTVLTNHQGEQYISTSPESLFYEHADLQIPWSDLAWWVRALPAPKNPHQKAFMSDGLRIEKLEQSGWVIDYLEYTSHQQFFMPQKIKFSNGDINATLIVREWVLTK